MAIDWLEYYNISSKGDVHHAEHNMKAVMDTLKAVHEKASAHLITVSDEKMEAENVIGFGFGGIKNKQDFGTARHQARGDAHRAFELAL